MTLDWLKGAFKYKYCFAKIELNVIFSKNRSDDVIVFESLVHLDLNGYTTVFQSSGLGSFFKILPGWKIYPWLEVWRSRAWEYYKHHAISWHCGCISMAHCKQGLVRWRMQLRKLTFRKVMGWQRNKAGWRCHSHHCVIITCNIVDNLKHSVTHIKPTQIDLCWQMAPSADRLSSFLLLILLGHNYSRWGLEIRRTNWDELLHLSSSALLIYRVI